MNEHDQSKETHADIVVNADPVQEAIACKLFGITNVPLDEQKKMIRRAAKAGAVALRAKGTP